MKTFKDNLPLVLSDDEFTELRHEYNYKDVSLMMERCGFWSLVAFYSIPVVLIVILNFFMGVPIYYIPLYYVFSTIVEMLIEYVYIRIIPRKQINKKLKEEEEKAREKELEDAEKRMIEEMKKNVFTKNKIIEIIDKYKAVKYPKYLETDIRKLFKRLDMFVGVIEDPLPYKSFFTNHLPEILDIVSKAKESEEEIILSKKAVNSIFQFATHEIKQHKLGVSLDENSTLNAYINLYGKDQEIGGKS